MSRAVPRTDEAGREQTRPEQTRPDETRPERTRPDQSPTPLLSVRDLQVRFHQYDRGLRRRSITVVDRMSLDVHRGEMLALVGASGAGKSLLAHSVLGLLPSNADQDGVVRWEGRLVAARERADLAGDHIALLPQRLTALDPTATVGAQLRRAARVARRPAQDGIEALLGTGLTDRVAGLYPHQLSGGMARRVLHAMTLLGEPQLVIADEPTPGLAPQDVADVLRRLRSLADDGRGVLLITHDIAAALQVADRLVIVRDGRTVDEADVADFTGDGERLRHPYTRALWRALPRNGFHVDDGSSADGSWSALAGGPADAVPQERTVPC